jgi:hypothetical protein
MKNWSAVNLQQCLTDVSHRTQSRRVVFERGRWTPAFAGVTLPKVDNELKFRYNTLFLVLTIFVLMLGFFTELHAKGSFNDVKFPHPKSIPVWNTQAQWRIEKDVVRVTAILKVDSKGLVTHASAPDSAHAKLFSYVEEFLKRLIFTPLTIDGKKGEGAVPVRVVFQPGMGYVDLELANDSTGAIADPILYDSMAALNGYAAPRIEKFPSYNCGLSYRDKFAVPPFILFKVASDTSGNITDAKLVKSTMPALTSQLQSAVRWAKLVPAKSDTLPLQSNPYLAVFFFPGINYPTRSFVVESSVQGASILEKSQLRLLPDTSKYLFLPIPKNPPYDSMYLRKTKAPSGLESLIASIQIDSSGNTSIHFPPRLSPSALTELKDITSSLKFYPALNFSGRPVPFYGTIRLEFTDSTLVRIWYEWLSP